MSPCDQHLLKHLTTTSGPSLWIVDENISNATIAQVAADGNLSAICNRIDIGTALNSRGIKTAINDFDFSSTGKFNNIIYRVSKERVLAQHCINQAFFTLQLDGELILLGEKNDGVKTLGKFAEKIFHGAMAWEKQGLCYIARLSKKRHTQATEDIQSHYSELQKITQNGFSFFSKPGVYGWKKIDIGSRLLVDTMIPRLERMTTETLSLLDLGCGYGYLILQLARFKFKKILATDNNVAAVTAAAKNFSVQNIDVELSLDDCGNKIDDKIDVVVCNPPFHQGFAHDKSLISDFIQRSLKLLSDNGVAYFVVNEFIALPKAVKQAGGHCQPLAHEHGFKVYIITH